MNKKLLAIAERAARSAGELLLAEYSADAGINSLAGRDIKTNADIAAHREILSFLEPTQIKILSEESFSTANPSFDITEPQWIIDPLDGTLNFSRGFPLASVSIAYWEFGKPVLGVLYDIGSKSLWSSHVGFSATIDRETIHVSSTSAFNQAILATGFPTGSSCDQDHVNHLYDCVKSFKKIRMLGCASLMLANVAAGRFDAYEELDIYIWDVAAGLALVSAAGGQYRLKPGNSPVQFHVYASNAKLMIP
jgi:myo-inositol-1(or 4)-monophosphatase